MIFDWTITFGNALTIASMLGGGFIALLSMKSDMRLIDQRVNRAELDLKKLVAEMGQLGIIAIQSARQDERMSGMDSRMTSLSDRITRVETHRRHL